MRQKKYLCKFDKFLSEIQFEESWRSVIILLTELTVLYLFMYFLPEIALYINGYVEPPRRHQWTMTWFSVLCFICLIFTVLKIVRLLRNKPHPEFTRESLDKKQTKISIEEERLKVEIEERKNERKNLTHHSSGTPNGAP